MRSLHPVALLLAKRIDEGPDPTWTPELESALRTGLKELTTIADLSSAVDSCVVLACRVSGIAQGAITARLLEIVAESVGPLLAQTAEDRLARMAAKSRALAELTGARDLIRNFEQSAEPGTASFRWEPVLALPRRG